jgi:ketosteroid isomerase-like protein
MLDHPFTTAGIQTYSLLCNGFKKVFRDKNRRYQYRFDLHHVYRSGDLAVARITWYLSIYENGRLISSTEDRGLDVFKRSRHGKWEIVYYLAYEHDGNE